MTKARALAVLRRAEKNNKGRFTPYIAALLSLSEVEWRHRQEEVMAQMLNSWDQDTVEVPEKTMQEISRGERKPLTREEVDILQEEQVRRKTKVIKHKPFVHKAYGVS